MKTDSLMKPEPQPFHSSGRPAAWISSTALPASLPAFTVATHSVSIRWYIFRSSTEDRGPWPGITFASAGRCSSTSPMLSLSPTALPPFPVSTKGKRPAKN